MPTTPLGPNSQYLSTVLNDPSPSHAAPASTSASNSPRRPRPSPAHPSHPQQPHPHLTAAQRSAQARGKPFNEADRTALGTPGRRGAQTQTPTPTQTQTDAESFAERQRRHEAVAVLDSQELLLWYAGARNESVTQTRRFFQNVVFGVPQPEPCWREAWDGRGLREGGLDVNLNLNVNANANVKGKGRAGSGRGTPSKRTSAGNGEGSGTG